MRISTSSRALPVVYTGFFGYVQAERIVSYVARSWCVLMAIIEIIRDNWICGWSTLNTRIIVKCLARLKYTWWANVSRISYGTSHVNCLCYRIKYQFEPSNPIISHFMWLNRFIGCLLCIFWCLETKFIPCDWNTSGQNKLMWHTHTESSRN